MGRTPIYLNASLLREVRMVAQHFFQMKKDENFWNSRRPQAQQPKPQVLLCTSCLSKGNTTKADVVSKGESLCRHHLSFPGYP